MSSSRRLVIIVFLCLLVVIGSVVYRQFRVYREKLGEITFYKDDKIELKLVEIFENLPWHYVGKGHSAACKSARTANFPEWKQDMIEAGWQRVPYSTHVMEARKQNDSLAAAAEVAKKVYSFQDGVLVVVSGTWLSFSFDDCLSFVNWDVLRDLPKDLITTTTAEAQDCEKRKLEDEKKGLKTYGDCAYYNFIGSNQPKFESIEASIGGQVSFLVRSPSISQAIQVKSSDFGKTWSVLPQEN